MCANGFPRFALDERRNVYRPCHVGTSFWIWRCRGNGKVWFPQHAMAMWGGQVWCLSASAPAGEYSVGVDAREINACGVPLVRNGWIRIGVSPANSSAPSIGQMDVLGKVFLLRATRALSCSIRSPNALHDSIARLFSNRRMLAYQPLGFFFDLA